MPVLRSTNFIENEKSGSDRGVIGCFAVLRSNHSLKLLLSNSHVIFSANGSPPLRLGSPGAGSCRCCCPRNIVALATTAGRSGEFSGTFVDCAVARLEPGVTGINQVAGLNPSNGLGGFLKGSATASEDQRVFVCTNSSSLPNRIIPGRVLFASRDVPIDATHFQRRQIVVEVDTGYEQDIVSGSGDSGSIVVDENNRIVALMHGRGSSTSGGDISEASNTIIACPIDAVMNALAIDILPESPPAPLAGPLLEDVPANVNENSPAVTEPALLNFQQLVRQTRTGLLYHDLGSCHGSEVIQLVHHCRPVTVTWHRNQGPAWGAHLMNSIRDPEYRVPEEVKGVRQEQLLTRMKEALYQHGSATLRADLDQYAGYLITLAGFQSVGEVVKRMGANEA